MRIQWLLAALALPAALLAGTVPAADGSVPRAELDWVAALQRGGLVLVLRHAKSPGQPPSAEQADPENATHERQLDETGKAAARAMGDALRRLHIPIGQVRSSPTYRAHETLRLAGIAPVVDAPELAENDDSMKKEVSAARVAWLRAQAATSPKAGTDSLLVTHRPNLMAAFAAELGSGGPPSDGEALVFRPDGHGGTALVARVKMEDWPRLATSPP